MAEQSYFFDDTLDNPRIYNADEHAGFFREFMSTGVFRKTGTPLLVSANNANMSVTISAGAALILGYLYKNTSALTLPIDSSEATMDRIDTVVLRLDKSESAKNITARVVKGTPASSPVAPALTESTYVHEIPLANILVTKGKSFIDNTQLTDRRTFVDITEYKEVRAEIEEARTSTARNKEYVSLDSRFESNEVLLVQHDERLNKLDIRTKLDPIIQGGYVSGTGVNTIKVWREGDDIIIYGIISGGTKAAGTRVLTTPSSVRPISTRIFSALTYSTTSPAVAPIMFTIATNGDILLYNTPALDLLFFDYTRIPNAF
jgi:hypothetical protein